ncbi:MAG: anhydro-N-acetylmuramic acid kinase, partial [Bacteroidales bacterium]
MLNKKKTWQGIGCMSGTSLDGIDLAFCHFEEKEDSWNYQIINAETLSYPIEWKNKLKNIDTISGRELFHLDHEYGKYLGRVILEFISKNDLNVDFIGSHGHTIFHEPAVMGSLQVGNGHDIYAVTGLPVVADFRSLDISLGGQGAPLVPAGDLHLFPDFPYCLNLGGFSNLSHKNQGIIAYDICPVNTVLNKISESFGIDNNGNFGRKGKVNSELLQRLNDLDFYKIPPPRSLGAEFLENIFFPQLLNSRSSNYDILATLYEHISYQISKNLNNSQKDKVLITGGGAKNSYLVQKIREKTKNQLIIPESELVNFKEALVFAFLALLRLKNQSNCYASVTGASRDSSCGT